jgi:hypothetical protein
MLDAPDPHGHNPLHVAALRGSAAATAALLAAGGSPRAKSRRGWRPLEEALASGDRATVLLLHRAAAAERRLERKARRAELLAALGSLPDVALRVKWELGSSVPGLGMLLRRYAPHDTYGVVKVGARLRVDGTLMGINPGAAMGGGGGGGGGSGRRGAGAAARAGRGASSSSTARQQQSQSSMLGHVGGPELDGEYEREAAAEAAVSRVDDEDEDSDGGNGDDDADTAEGLLPSWKRGHFSLVVDGTEAAAAAAGGGAGGAGAAAAIAAAAAAGGTNGASAAAAAAPSTPTTPATAPGPRIIFINHTRKWWMDLGSDRKAMKGDEAAAVEEELLATMEESSGGGAAPRRRQRPRAGGGGNSSSTNLFGGSDGDDDDDDDGGFGPSTSTSTSAPKKTRLKLRAVKLEPARASALRAWLGGGAAPAADGGPPQLVESAEGWPRCRVYDATARLAAVSTSKAPLRALMDRLEREEEEEREGAAAAATRPSSSSSSSAFARYLAAARHAPEDSVEEMDVLQMAMDEADAAAAEAAMEEEEQDGGGRGVGGSSGAAPQPDSSGKKPRVVRARLWMADGVSASQSDSLPLTLGQLLPLLEIVGTANKPIARAVAFLRGGGGGGEEGSGADDDGNGDDDARRQQRRATQSVVYALRDMFPVCLQVPLLLTVYAKLAFERAVRLRPGGGGAGGGARRTSGWGVGAAAASSSSTGSAPPPLPTTVPAPSFFEVPPGYRRKMLADAVDGALLAVGGDGAGGF